MNPYEQQLLSLAKSDPNVIVMTAENRAPMRSITGDLGHQFIDVGIAEQTMIGMAAGLALRGFKPVVHALAAFLTMRAYEFIRTDVGIAKLPVVLVGFVPGVLSDGNGPTHQAIEDIALMRTIPGMNIFCPADLNDLASNLPRILGGGGAGSPGGPWYVRYPSANPVLPGANSAIRPPAILGEPALLRDGSDVTVITYGSLVSIAQAAAEELAARGVSTRVVYLHTLRPLDDAALESAAGTSRSIVALEDHRGTGGLYSMLTEWHMRRQIATAGALPPRFVHSLSFGDRWFTPATLPRVLEHEGLTPHGVAASVLSLITPEVQHA